MKVYISVIIFLSILASSLLYNYKLNPPDILSASTNVSGANIALNNNPKGFHEKQSTDEIKKSIKNDELDTDIWSLFKKTQVSFDKLIAHLEKKSSDDLVNIINIISNSDDEMRLKLELLDILFGILSDKDINKAIKLVTASSLSELIYLDFTDKWLEKATYEELMNFETLSTLQNKNQVNEGEISEFQIKHILELVKRNPDTHLTELIQLIKSNHLGYLEEKIMLKNLPYEHYSTLINELYRSPNYSSAGDLLVTWLLKNKDDATDFISNIQDKHYKDELIYSSFFDWQLMDNKHAKTWFMSNFKGDSREQALNTALRFGDKDKETIEWINSLENVNYQNAYHTVLAGSVNSDINFAINNIDLLDSRSDRIELSNRIFKKLLLRYPKEKADFFIVNSEFTIEELETISHN
jgi:hypothetical protein